MNTVSIKMATSEEAIWIFDELGEGARVGHFAKSFLDEYQRMGAIAQVITRNDLPVMKQRSGSRQLEVLPADLWVGFINGIPAGFLLSLHEDRPGRSPAVELHLAGTGLEFRRRRVFSTLVEHQLALTPSGVRVYARCYRESRSAISALQALGFQTSRCGDPIEMTITTKPKLAPHE